MNALDIMISTYNSITAALELNVRQVVFHALPFATGCLSYLTKDMHIFHPFRLKVCTQEFWEHSYQIVNPAEVR